MPRNRLKINQKALPPLDLKLFRELRKILFLTFNGNDSACARALGISRITWVRWDTIPPTWPYWNYILRLVITSSIRIYNDKYHKDSFITAKTKSKAWTHLQKIRKRLAQLPDDGELLAQIEEHTYTRTASEEYLRQLLLHGPLAWSIIRKPANSGGYSEAVLRRAARTLGVIKQQIGFGEDKDSVWSLPEVGED